MGWIPLAERSATRICCRLTALSPILFWRTDGIWDSTICLAESVAHTDLVGIERCSTYRSGRCVWCGTHAALERHGCAQLFSRAWVLRPWNWDLHNTKPLLLICTGLEEAERNIFRTLFLKGGSRH